jgi:hypothetical protein
LFSAHNSTVSTLLYHYPHYSNYNELLPQLFTCALDEKYLDLKSHYVKLLFSSCKKKVDLLKVDLKDATEKGMGKKGKLLSSVSTECHS